MTLAATMASLVALASRSAILGYRLSVLACILVCLIRFRGRDEETTSSRNYCTANGNIGIGPIFRPHARYVGEQRRRRRIWREVSCLYSNADASQRPLSRGV